MSHRLNTINTNLIFGFGQVRFGKVHRGKNQFELSFLTTTIQSY